jgi:hypothetical protein
MCSWCFFRGSLAICQEKWKHDRSSILPRRRHRYISAAPCRSPIWSIKAATQYSIGIKRHLHPVLRYRDGSNLQSEFQSRATVNVLLTDDIKHAEVPNNSISNNHLSRKVVTDGFHHIDMTNKRNTSIAYDVP